MGTNYGVQSYLKELNIILRCTFNPNRYLHTDGVENIYYSNSKLNAEYILNKANEMKNKPDINENILMHI